MTINSNYTSHLLRPLLSQQKCICDFTSSLTFPHTLDHFNLDLDAAIYLYLDVDLDVELHLHPAASLAVCPAALPP